MRKGIKYLSSIYQEVNLGWFSCLVWQVYWIINCREKHLWDKEGHSLIDYHTESLRLL